MQDYRWALVCIMATGLALAGCSDPPDNSVPAEKSANPPVNEQTETRVQVDLAPKQKETREPAPTGEKEKTRKPLDLSLPPQPKIAPGSGDNTGASRENILPDLFQQEQKPDDSRSMHFKGRVLMKQGTEPNLDSLEGGQVIIEMKTR